MITTDTPEGLVDRVRNWFENQRKGKELNRKFIKNQLKLARKNRNVKFAIIHLGFLLGYSRSQKTTLEIYKLIILKFSICRPEYLVNEDGYKYLPTSIKNEEFIKHILRENRRTVQNEIIESACLAQLYVLDAHSLTFEHQNLEAISYLDKFGLGVYFRERCRGLYGEIMMDTRNQFAA